MLHTVGQVVVGLSGGPPCFDWAAYRTTEPPTIYRDRLAIGALINNYNEHAVGYVCALQ
jgi:hypothetical protein